MLEELRKFIPIFESFLSGKEVQEFNEETKCWELVSDKKTLNLEKKYRIKPEKKFVPYTLDNKFLLKNAWVKPISDLNNIYLITSIHDKGVVIDGSEITYASLLKNFLFEDGGICGLEVTEK